jgi:hypothetical protein
MIAKIKFSLGDRKLKEFNNYSFLQYSDRTSVGRSQAFTGQPIAN